MALLQTASAQAEDEAEVKMSYQVINPCI